MRLHSRWAKASVALAAVFAVASCGAVASASAHEFIASKTGSLTGGGSGLGITTSFGGKLRCEDSFIYAGSIAGLKPEVIEAGISHTDCVAEGFEMTLPSFEYAFHANGTATLLKAFTITVKNSCSLTFTPSAGEEGAATYTNSSSSVEEHLVDKNVKTTVTGFAPVCGPKEQTSTIEEAKTSIGVEAGTLKWE